MIIEKKDEIKMFKAIKLALNGTGNVSPNPRVGCLIVKDDNIISEGWHKEFGMPHAEVEAINNANDSDLEGSTMYVTLEPCVHEGKTPPCVPLIIEKKIKKVVIGMLDPNPIVCGNGVTQLREAGIEVVSGVLEDDCRWINRFFTKYITTELPYIIVKVAQSIDGCIATKNNQSKYITSEDSIRRTHSLRAEVDAVMVGSNTVKIDNPKLTVRTIKGRNPKRIVLDSKLSSYLGQDIFTDPYLTQTFVCCNEKSSETRKADALRAAGIEVIAVEEILNGKLDLFHIFQILGRDYNLSSILIEGGAKLFSSVLSQQLFDELHIFIAPIIIGNGIHSFDNFSINELSEAPHFNIKSIFKSGVDTHIIAMPVR